MAQLLKTSKKGRRANPKKAKEILRRLKESSERYGGPTKGLTTEQVVALVKKTREELWDQYLASRPRR